MGYYVYHEKATLIKPVPYKPISVAAHLEEDYTEFDVPFSFFEPFIQLVETPIIAKTIRIESNYPRPGEKEWEAVQKSDRYAGLQVYRESHLNGETIYLYRFEQKRGFYVETVYEEKLNADDDFTNVYELGKSFTSYDAFESVVKQQDYSWYFDTGQLTELEREQYETNFRQKFLGEYEYGRSILFYC